MIYLLLFYEFFKIWLFAIGGGLAALPFLFDLLDKYDWYTTAELTNMIAISESTPGPIAVNMATYVGYHTGGLLGSVVATLALIMPAIIISLLICKAMAVWRDNQYVEMVFSGLRPAVAGLLAAISISLISLALFGTEHFAPGLQLNLKALIFLIVVTPAVFYFNKHPIIFIALGAAVGIIFQL